MTHAPSARVNDTTADARRAKCSGLGLAAGLWAIGSGLLSKEIEGDDRVDTHSRGAGAA